MSEVISFRLDPNNPREAEAMRVLTHCQEQGYSVRHILTEALLNFERMEADSNAKGQLEQILMLMHQITDQLHHLQESGSKLSELPRGPQAALSEAFVLSVKSAAKPGITLET